MTHPPLRAARVDEQGLERKEEEKKFITEGFGPSVWSGRLCLVTCEGVTSGKIKMPAAGSIELPVPLQCNHVNVDPPPPPCWLAAALLRLIINYPKRFLLAASLFVHHKPAENKMAALHICTVRAGTEPSSIFIYGGK